MNPLGATNEPNRRQTETPGVQTVARGFHHIGMVGQSEVVVGAHVDDIRAVRQRDVVFLVRGNNPLCFPETRLFDASNFVGEAGFCRLVAHVSPSSRG